GIRKLANRVPEVARQRRIGKSLPLLGQLLKAPCSNRWTERFVGEHGSLIRLPGCLEPSERPVEEYGRAQFPQLSGVEQVRQALLKDDGRRNRQRLALEQVCAASVIVLDLVLRDLFERRRQDACILPRRRGGIRDGVTFVDPPKYPTLPESATSQTLLV